MEQVRNLRESITALPIRAQLSILGIAIASVFVVFFVLRTATSTEWVTATSSLRMEKASQAQKALEDAKIKSRLSEDSQGVQVPKDMLNVARAKLAEANLLGAGSHTGCDQIYGDSKSLMSATSEREKINFKQCTENQLANQIESIGGVSAASVTVVVPDSQIFTDEQSRPTAAITVTTDGASLEASQVKAISRLAASSVKDLDPSDVTIVDEAGNLLSTASGSGEDGTVTDQQAKLRVQQQYNQTLEQKLTNTFEQVTGAGKVKVVSNVELDMDSITREVKDFGGETNERGPVSGQEWDTEQLAPDGTVPGGTAGTASNIGADPDNRLAEQVNATGNGTGYLHDIGKQSFSNDEVREMIRVAAGNVKANHIAVIIDNKVSADDVAALKVAAHAATGYRAEDTIEIVEANLSTAGKAAQAGASARLSGAIQYIKWALLGLGLIGMAFFLRRTLNQRTYELLNPTDEVLALEYGFEPIPLRELEAAISAANSVDNQKRLELQRKVEVIAQKKPNDVAQQIRGWLHEADQR